MTNDAYSRPLHGGGIITIGSRPSLEKVTFKVRTHKAAEELARQMCDQMRCKIYYSDADKPQDGWFIVSTEPFEEK